MAGMRAGGPTATASAARGPGQVRYVNQNDKQAKRHS